MLALFLYCKMNMTLYSTNKGITYRISGHIPRGNEVGIVTLIWCISEHPFMTIVYSYFPY